MLMTVLAPLLFSFSTQAQPSLSAQLERPAKQSEANGEKCASELKDLPSAKTADPSEIISGLKATPKYPKESSDILEIIANNSIPMDQSDVDKVVKILDQLPECSNSNSLMLQSNGAKRIIENGTKRQKDDFTAALVSRLRVENKKTQLLLPLMVSLEALEQLADAGLVVASAKDDIHAARARAKELSQQLADKYADPGESTSTRDNKQRLEIRRAELSSSRQVQALIDGILKKI